MKKLKKVFCALFGHSKVIDTCIGYVHCARCGEQIGDALGGYFNGKGYAIVGHGCPECKEAYKKMRWWHKILSPNPFKGDMRHDEK